MSDTEGGHELGESSKDGRYLLRWNGFEEQVTHTVTQAYRTKEFTDMVLICQGMQFCAHQVVVSVFSKYFNDILKDHPTDLPVITIDGINGTDLKSILDYMYLGSAQISDSDLPRFFEAAKFLQIRGLENGAEHSDFTRWESDDKSRDGYDNDVSDDDMESPLNLAPKSENDDDHSPMNEIAPPSLSPATSTEDDSLSKQYPLVNLQVAASPSHIPEYYKSFENPLSEANRKFQLPLNPPQSFPPSILSKKLMRSTPEYRSASHSPARTSLPTNLLEEFLKTDPHQVRAMLDPKLENLPFYLANLAANQSIDQLPESFTTSSGLVVSTTTYDNSRQSSFPLKTLAQSRASASTTNSSLLFSQQASIKPSIDRQFAKDFSTSSNASSTHSLSSASGRKRTGLNYSPAQVSAIVESVESIEGPFLPCAICAKIVKRERLRSHIYECHLVNGEKIPCPVCGVELKSKGSYRVHVWRHRKGSLKNRQMKHNVNATLGNPP